MDQNFWVAVISAASAMISAVAAVLAFRWSRKSADAANGNFEPIMYLTYTKSRDEFYGRLTVENSNRKPLKLVDICVKAPGFNISIIGDEADGYGNFRFSDTTPGKKTYYLQGFLTGQPPNSAETTKFRHDFLLSPRPEHRTGMRSIVAATVTYRFVGIREKRKKQLVQLVIE